MPPYMSMEIYTIYRTHHIKGMTSQVYYISLYMLLQHTVNLPPSAAAMQLCKHQLGMTEIPARE